jgi:RNA polymerase-binding transcription factor DksA
MATIIHRIRTRDRGRHAMLEKLLSQQESILRSHRQIFREGLPTVTSGVLDAEEHSLDAEEQGVGLSLLALTSQSVLGIEAALRRLDDGDFGTCSDCRGEIGGARLRAQPYATLCLTCQEKYDGTGAWRWPGPWRPRQRDERHEH